MNDIKKFMSTFSYQNVIVHIFYRCFLAIQCQNDNVNELSTLVNPQGCC